MISKVEHQRHGLDLIKIDNDDTKIVFTNYGARIVSWKYHDNNIVLGNVVEADEFYFEEPFNFGATIGRYAGRIENASFKLDDDTFQLESNDGQHHLHGGSHGLNRRIFDYEIVDDIGQVKIIFTTTIKEEEDNYPGDMMVKVIHTYDANHRWSVQYEAKSTKKTVFNPSNHVYFNLNRDNNVVYNHCINSSALKMYMLNNKHIVDHPFEFGGNGLTIDNSEFELNIKTDMPHFVMFTFNDPQVWNNDFNIYKAHSGFSIETQYMPNDINMYGAKAQSILEADTLFTSKTSFQIHEK